ncbi:hypothetical protein [Pseudoalteromonas ardens]|uniref:DUF1579 domain-containing protein n=1 Tax=Pseudoalteromonas rubra TaxID=43658 RepID=A0A0L0ERB7_9GAMM|nr:hypothetical protein [Pseudoalteromonas sp. R96]KNC66946.1 hypothetical protein AC626_13970 [Pseudoalteromonas rubra]MDK1313715.1 hypothetical protein [Pseudoalteromonas sp. R96]
MRRLSLCFFCAYSFASDSADLYPGAPAAASDYAFLIGHWQCQYEQLDLQGKVQFSSPCRWQAQYAFDNKMVVDDFSLLDAQGKVTYAGRTLRTYSLQDKRWHQVFLPVQMNATLNPFTAQRDNDGVHLKVEQRLPGGKLQPARFRFSQISDKGFVWESSKQLNGSDSWYVDMRLRATRVGE